jgi:hypothetical protein
MDDFPDWTPEQARRAKRLAWAMGLTALVCWGMAAAAITAFVLFLTQ